MRFKMTQNFLPYGENWVRLAEYIRQELGKIGIEVETQSLDLGGWLKAIYTDWDYDFTSNFTPQLLRSVDRRAAHVHLRQHHARARRSPTR